MKGYTKRGKKVPYWGKTRSLMRKTSRRTLRRASRTSADVSYRLYSEKKHMREYRRWRRYWLMKRVIVPSWLIFVIIVAVILSEIF